MIVTNNPFVILIKRNPNWIILYLTGIWLFGWLMMIGVVSFGIVTDIDKFDGELTLGISFFFIIGLFVLKIFLWHLRGKEKITIDNNELRIDKVGTILTVPRKYEINQITNIRNTEKSTKPKWIIFWGIGGGQIEFDYFEQTKYFGQTLTVLEANKIIENIKLELPIKNTI